MSRTYAHKVFSEHAMDIRFWEAERDYIVHAYIQFASDQRNRQSYVKTVRQTKSAPWVESWWVKLLMRFRRWRFIPMLKVDFSKFTIVFVEKCKWGGYELGWYYINVPKVCWKLRVRCVRWISSVKWFPDWVDYLLNAKQNVIEYTQQDVPEGILDLINCQINILRVQGKLPGLILLGGKAEFKLRQEAFMRYYYEWAPYASDPALLQDTGFYRYMGCPVRECQWLAEDAVVVVPEEDL